MVMGRGFFLSLFVESIWGREVIHNLFPKFYVRYEGYLFHGPRKSEEGADTDLIHVHNFCLPIVDCLWYKAF